MIRGSECVLVVMVTGLETLKAQLIVRCIVLKYKGLQSIELNCNCAALKQCLLKVAILHRVIDDTLRGSDWLDVSD